MISRFIFRLILLFTLPCVMLAMGGIIVGQAQPYQEWEILAFSRQVRKETGIYLMDTYHKFVMMLIEDKSENKHYYFINWIPGQKRFLYSTYISDYPQEHYIFDLTTRTSTLITSLRNFNTGFFLLSPDGESILITDYDNLYLIDVATDQALNVTNLPSDSSTHINPWSFSWSPDGKFAAFLISNNIYLLETENLKVHQLTQPFVTDGLINRSLDWSPDRQKIAFTTVRDQSRDSGISDLFTINISTGHIEQLTHNESYFHTFHSPNWSPDGNLIRFVDETNTRRVIQTINIQNSILHRYVSITRIQKEQWSSDEKGLAFFEFVEGPHQYMFKYLDLTTGNSLPLFDYRFQLWRDITNYGFLPKVK